MTENVARPTVNLNAARYEGKLGTGFPEAAQKVVTSDTSRDIFLKNAVIVRDRVKSAIEALPPAARPYCVVDIVQYASINGKKSASPFGKDAEWITGPIDAMNLVSHLTDRINVLKDFFARQEKFDAVCPWAKYPVTEETDSSDPDDTQPLVDSSVLDEIAAYEAALKVEEEKSGEEKSGEEKSGEETPPVEG